MKRKNKLRCLSFLLSIVMIFCSTVFTVTAEQVTANLPEPTQTAVPDTSGDTVLNEVTFEDPNSFIPAVYEVEDRREENVKHFSMPDGTYKAVVYGDAVHRLDSNGEWQDIDNRLTLVTQNDIRKYTTADGRVSFAQSASPSASGTPIFTLTENGYLVAMAVVTDSSNGSISEGNNVSLASSASVTTHALRAELTADDSAEEQYEKLKAIYNTTEIVYTDIASNTDIEYILMSNNIKENIVVKAPRTGYAYSFQIAVKGLVI